MKRDTYQFITDKIVAVLETGVCPWLQPWGKGIRPHRPLRHNGIPYHGVNTILLWLAAAEQGYNSAYWLTFKQALGLGASVRKGEKSTLVVYSRAIEKGTTVDRKISFSRGYAVFNAQQIDGLPVYYYYKPAPTDEPKQAIKNADIFFANLGADIRNGGNSAYYSLETDHVQMPRFDAFSSAEAYAGTLAHELIRWTSSRSRLNRDLLRCGRDKDAYAREALIAELGACFLCCDLGIKARPRDDHASHIGLWMKILKGDKRAIFQAASVAEKAVGFMQDLQPLTDVAPSYRL
ncbi:ArdC family protein [Agrobacterium sp. V1]|uniref:ArdC family protein n=1 Tax=Agrobacterium sp. V1 TaxID=3061957 RepID=UPI00267209A9|nr:zincin-like metallopeptidase domain-containing protein [Agrobacterium sp. V1]MDO3445248.1 zincin-like metallopeptidase domain-containing protein [Agrobacterium sp. V1]